MLSYTRVFLNRSQPLQREADGREGHHVNSTVIKESTLDQIIAIQFTVAWAGEALSDPPRLKWWRTDLVDEYGGGDLLERLAPRSHKWASLEAVREAAILTDKKARQRMADPDKVRTLYFWGFEIDEQVTERLRALKMSQRDPAKALPIPLDFSSEFDKDELEKYLKSDVPADFMVQMSGRELKQSLPDDLSLAAKTLATALLPLSEEYPAPFFRIS